MSQRTPWAVLLCKFADDLRGFVTINIAQTEAMFTASDAENIPAFWQDVSYGALDLSGSRAFGWLTLAQKQSDYVGSGANGAGRQALVDWAKQAAANAGIDLSPFYGVAVFMSTPTDLWGAPHTVVCDLLSPMSAILQEYGHGFGLENHSRAVATPTTDYTDPFCVMSAMTFGGADPTFSGPFGTSGPLVCAPYVDIAGWLTPGRKAVIGTNGSRPTLTTVRLASLGEQSPAHPQAAIFDLQTPYAATSYVEYRAGGWDRGLAQTQVVIHQRRPDGFAYYAGTIPASVGTANGVTLLPGRAWTDPTFDLSVRLEEIWDAGETVAITVGPRAAALPLSVRAIAREKLHLAGSLSIRQQVLQPGTASLRASLLALLNR